MKKKKWVQMDTVERAELMKEEFNKRFNKDLEGIPGVFDIDKLPKDARDELHKRLADEPNISHTIRIYAKFIKDIELKVDKQGNYQISRIKLIKIIGERDIQEKIRNYEREELNKKLNAKAIVVCPGVEYSKA